jgi:methyl coenzyme M reductase subunit D
MGYMRYRSMVYSFQDDVIPHICETLMPFFYRIEEGVRISELSYLQENLKVSEMETSVDNVQLPISQEQQLQAEYVFMILKKIVEFNYNITYTEYESEQVIETCLITFPDSILEKIINY